MGRLPRELEAKRQRLARAALRGAFDSYVRHGRVPDAYARIAELVREAKNLGDSVGLPTGAVAKLPTGRPTQHYTWRTAGDRKVRDAHAALNGRIFSWAHPPEHGHPGTEPNCRCWPEPYYGDPAVADEMLELVPERRIDTDPGVPWARIDTLTRPDGSLAASSVVMNDASTIESSFVGSSRSNRVTLPDGTVVRVESRNGIDAIYAGGDATPLFGTRWGTTGPTIKRAQRRFALLMDDPLGPDIYSDPLDSELEPDVIFDPNPVGSLLAPDPAGLGAIGAALLLLYLMRQAEPEAMGAGKRDAAYLAFRAWTNGTDADGKAIPVPIAVGSITEEQARQSCPLLPEVQSWTDMAALTLAMGQPDLSSQTRGIKLHAIVKSQVDARKRDLPFLYRGVSAEYSISAFGKSGRYGDIDETV